MKKKFLDDLKKYLSPLNEEERDEIIRFYEERFYTGTIYEGKTESDIIDELESPRQIARNVLEEYGYNPNQRIVETKPDAFNPWRLVGVILFDFLAITAIIPFLFAIFVSTGAGLIGFLFNIAIGSYGTYATIFMLGISVFWFLLFIWLFDTFIIFMTWLIRWNLDALQIKKPSIVLKKFRKLTFSSLFRRSRTARSVRTLVVVSGVIAFFVGGFFSFMHYGNIEFSRDRNLVEGTENFDITSPNAFTITTDIDLGSIDIRTHSENTVLIGYNEREDVPFEITFNSDTNALDITNELEYRFFTSLFFWEFWLDQPEVIIYLPEDVTVDSIDLSSTNGAQAVRNIDVDSIIMKSLNGRLTVENLDTDTINLQTTNGTIRVEGVEADSVYGKTTNGNIELHSVTAEDYDFTTTNGSVTAKHLNVSEQDGLHFNAQTTNGKISLQEVYVDRVVVRTTNGSIDYYNQDLTFNPTSVTTSTTNGSVSTNVE